MRHNRIGRWMLEPTDGTLTSEHQTVRLEPKVLSVLLRLIERKGEVVLHEDLLREVWQDTHVVPGALARTISLLRSALDDDAYHPSYIETVPKRGYRLIAGVEQIAPLRRHAPYLRPFAVAATVSLLVFVVGHGGHTMHMMRCAASWTFFNHQTRVGNETAFEHYARAVDNDPASAEAHAGLATAYVFRANYLPDRDRWAAAAVESAKRAVALDADNAMAARAAGMAHLQAGRITEAEPYFRRALGLDPGDLSTPLNLGRALRIRGDLAGALAMFEARVKARPDVDAYAHLAEALWLVNRYGEAVAAARSATELEPFAREPQLLLIRHDLVFGDHAAAQSRLSRLLQAHPDCTQCVVQLGLIDQLSGNLAAAETRYREAAAMKPPFVGASLRLAQVPWLTGRRQESATVLREIEQSAQQALGNTAQFWFPHWNLAAAAAIRGDRQEALKWFREAVRLGRRDSAWDGFDPMFEAVRPLMLESGATSP